MIVSLPDSEKIIKSYDFNQCLGSLESGNIHANYPVIAALGDSSSIVAYLTKKGEEKFVAYQVVGLK